MTNLLESINYPEDLKKLSIDELAPLSDEIREFIRDTVLETGGHLGSNLGIVELTLALHYVFDFKHDSVIFDVSHQCYTHKILTGRKNKFNTLRKFKGLSGFTSADESPYDPFTMGHAGSSISTALGIAIGNKITAKQHKSIAVIGDGSMTAGIAFEALNYAGTLKKNLVVILNDNFMSISQTVGAMSNYLNKIRLAPLYKDIKNDVYATLAKLPYIGTPMEKVFEHLRNSIKSSLGGIIFEELGFHYYGPFDGHNTPNLISLFNEIKKIKEPVLIHVLTEKGKGYTTAEKHPYKMHGVSPTIKFKEPVEGIPKPNVENKAKYTDVFADTLIEIASSNKKVTAITAAMPDGTGLVKFGEKFPNRYFDVGICEQNAIGIAAGMCKVGLRPFAGIYSTFMQRAVDQVFQEVTLQNLPVCISMDRAGLVGNDGPTHHGVFDIAYLRGFPNLILMAPRDGEELAAMLRFTTSLNQPSAIRYPRANTPKHSLLPPATPIELGKMEVLKDGDDGCIIAYGSMVYPAYFAAQSLKSSMNLDLTVINGRFAKPIDRLTLYKQLTTQPFILTIEEHSIIGGFGSAILETASELSTSLPPIFIHGIPDDFITHGDRKILLESVELDKKGISNKIKKLLENLSKDKQRVKE